MQPETKERWLQLCDQAAVEQDPEKFLQLITEINNRLREKRERLTSPLPPQPAPSKSANSE